MTRDTATRCTCTYLYLLELQCNMQCRKTNKMKTTKGLKRLTVYHTCRLGYITPFRYNKRVWQTDRQTELVQQLRIPRFASAQWCKTALLPCMQISLKHETARNGNKVIATCDDDVAFSPTAASVPFHAACLRQKHAKTPQCIQRNAVLLLPREWETELPGICLHHNPRLWAWALVRTFPIF